MFKIGFGCVGLTSLSSRRESLAILEHAYSQGITHFDVARLYGMGLTESIVGEFAKNKRHEISITTKFGLNPPSIIVNHRNLQNFVKKSIKRMPFVKKLVAKKIHSKFEPVFSVENARTSLDKRLTELNTDYIDYYLMHEATLEAANSDDMICFLDNKIKEGKILKFGIGTAFSHIHNDCNLFNCNYYVFQFENNIFNENLLKIKNSDSKLLVTYSVFKDFNTINQWLDKAEVQNIRKYSNEIGIDIKDNNVIAGMFLYHSALSNPNGITLFSSTRGINISNNMKYLRQFIQLNLKVELINKIFKQIRNDIG